MKNIAWISRNPILPAELTELRAKFGECVLLEHKKTFADAKEIVKWVREDNAKYAIIVAPLSVISHLLKDGPEINWLYAEMVSLHDCTSTRCRNFDPSRDVIVNRRGIIRHHRFVGFKKIIEVRIILEPI